LQGASASLLFVAAGGIVDVAERHARRRDVPRRVRLIVGTELGFARLSGRAQILQQKLHLLHNTPADDLIVLIELERQSATEESFFLDVALNELLECCGVRLCSKLQDMAPRQLRFPLRRDEDAVSVYVPAVNLTSHEEQQPGREKVHQRLAQYLADKTLRDRGRTGLQLARLCQASVVRTAGNRALKRGFAHAVRAPGP
jgi:hypothetical protein